jgi:hypothetical protein
VVKPGRHYGRSNSEKLWSSGRWDETFVEVQSCRHCGAGRDAIDDGWGISRRYIYAGAVLARAGRGFR